MAALGDIRLTLLVGQYAQRWHLGASPDGSLTATVADWRRHLGSNRHRSIPLPHPSWRNNGWLKANPWFDAELVPVLRREVRRALNAA